MVVEVTHPDGGHLTDPKAVHKTDGGRTNDGPLSGLAATLGHELKVAGASVWAEGARAIHLRPPTANPPQEGHGTGFTQPKIFGHADSGGSLKHPTWRLALHPQAGEVGIHFFSGTRKGTHVAGVVGDGGLGP